LISFPSIEGIPLLVLGNKNDVEGSYNESRLIEAMNLRTLKDRMVGCYSISAKNITNIDITFKWLNNLKKNKKKKKKKNNNCKLNFKKKKMKKIKELKMRIC